MSGLTVHDLEPGKLYRVVDTGNADPSFLGATVLGAEHGCKGVTIAFAPGSGGDWWGARWGAPEEPDDDEDARFEPIEPEERFTDVQRDAVLAGLRLLQSRLRGENEVETSMWIDEILTNSGAHEPITDEEIGDLCDLADSPVNRP